MWQQSEYCWPIPALRIGLLMFQSCVGTCLRLCQLLILGMSAKYLTHSKMGVGAGLAIQQSQYTTSNVPLLHYCTKVVYAGYSTSAYFNEDTTQTIC